MILQHTKNNKLLAIFILLLAFLSAEGMTMDLIQFKIEGSEEGIRFILTNISSENITVNKKFSIGPAGKRGNIELIFTDKIGNKHHLSAKINYSQPQESDFISLSPSSFVGKTVTIETLKSYYNLEQGEYEVEGLYKNNDGKESGAFIGSSNISKLTVKIN